MQQSHEDALNISTIIILCIMEKINQIYYSMLLSVGVLHLVLQNMVDFRKTPKFTDNTANVNKHSKRSKLF